MHFPVVSPADRDKIGEISRAALGPVAEVMPVNAQMLSSGRLPHIATVSPPERQRCRVATLTQSPKPLLVDGTDIRGRRLQGLGDVERLEGGAGVGAAFRAVRPLVRCLCTLILPSA